MVLKVIKHRREKRQITAEGIDHNQVKEGAQADSFKAVSSEERPADREETAERCTPSPLSFSIVSAALTFEVQEKVWIVLYFPC